jgi:hypothetical protein
MHLIVKKRMVDQIVNEIDCRLPRIGRRKDCLNEVFENVPGLVEK